MLAAKGKRQKANTQVRKESVVHRAMVVCGIVSFQGVFAVMEPRRRVILLF